MKTKLLPLWIACALFVAAVPASFVMLIAFNTGCSSVAQGSDPIVVNAERLSASAFDIIDSFLQYEAANTERLWAIDKGIKKTADILRDQAPPSLVALRHATKAYKGARTPENKANLQTWLATVNSLLADATTNMSKAVKP